MAPETPLQLYVTWNVHVFAVAEMLAAVDGVRFPAFAGSATIATATSSMSDATSILRPGLPNERIRLNFIPPNLAAKATVVAPFRTDRDAEGRRSHQGYPHTLLSAHGLLQGAWVGGARERLRTATRHKGQERRTLDPITNFMDYSDDVCI